MFWIICDNLVGSKGVVAPHLANGVSHFYMVKINYFNMAHQHSFFYFIFIYFSLQRVILPTYRRAPSPFLLQATARREPVPAPGGRRWDRQPERREVPGIEPETPAP